MSILGTRVLRREDPDLLTGAGTYVDGLRPENLAYVTYVTSPIAHARIRSIEVEAARQAPGVLGVFTAADLPFQHQPSVNKAFNADMRRPYLASDEVRFVGEPVVALVTEELYQGSDAAELVEIDYDPLPVVVDPKRALNETDVLVHEGAGTNLAFEMKRRGELELSDCEVVIRATFVNQRVAPAPIEPRTALADWSAGPGTRIVQWASCQGVHPVRDALAKAYNVEPSEVRVIGRDVGGSFGAKNGFYSEEVLLPFLSAQVQRPVRWTESRSANMVGLGHGRAQVQEITLGGTRDGKILAYDMNVIQDSGAYPNMGALLPSMTRIMLTGVYDIPRATFGSRSVVTNTTPIVSYRGAGRPEAAAAIERAIDMFAAEVGLDAAEVRRRN
ncbi:MAG: aerobic carbon-monoxide dehydrogenase large subunit, partial [Acidimicrobiia bacterium]|nr:aerobic carbon-monoxide dehydrogenase large subunit [Acidimicrobiia bacterium]